MTRKPKRIPQILFPEDLEKVFKTFLTKSTKSKLNQYYWFCRIRNITMFYLIYWTGLRPSECRKAKITDLDINKKTLFIPAQNNKQRQEDNIYLPEFLIENLYSYLSIRQKLFSSSEFLFPSKKGKEITMLNRTSFDRIFRNSIKKAGLYKISYIDGNGLKRGNFSLYSLRHSYGTIVYAKTKDIRKTASLLRHYDFQCRSTLRYIHTTQNLARKDLIKEIFPKEMLQENEQ